MNRCKSCGIIINERAKYCPSCGMPVDHPSNSSVNKSFNEEEVIDNTQNEKETKPAKERMQRRYFLIQVILGILLSITFFLPWMGSQILEFSVPQEEGFGWGRERLTGFELVQYFYNAANKHSESDWLFLEFLTLGWYAFASPFISLYMIVSGLSNYINPPYIHDKHWPLLSCLTIVIFLFLFFPIFGITLILGISIFADDYSLFEFIEYLYIGVPISIIILVLYFIEIMSLGKRYGLNLAIKSRRTPT